MSLYLLDQKLGSKSQPGSSSHKFVIKGRQTGSMHRGHTWVFRAETYETMQAWYDDIKTLTEKTGEERNAFVRRHASVRSASAGSARSASSDGGLEEDEADAIPYSAAPSVISQAARDQSPQRSSRPSPGGRFPSDLNVNRSLQAPLSPSSGSSEVGNDLTTAAGGPKQDVHPMYLAQTSAYQPVEPDHLANYTQSYQQDNQAASYVNPYPPTQQTYDQTVHSPQPTHPASYVPAMEPFESQRSYAQPTYADPDPAPVERHDSNYGSWMGPAAGGVAAGAMASEAYRRKQMEQRELAQQHEIDEDLQSPQQGEYYPVEQVKPIRLTGAAPAIPERDPDHIAPDLTTAPAVQPTIPAPVVAASTIHDTQATRDDVVATPATTTDSFLGDSEVGAAPFGASTINGGPVPVELVETAQAMAHPGVYRQNTDISVSDLHVPGEYPKVKAAGESTFLRYS